MAQDETVQTQEKQAFEPHKNLCPPSSDSKSAVTVQDKEEILMTPCTPEETQRELPAAAVMSKMELLVPETQVASDPLATENVESWGRIDGCSHETESEDNPVEHKSQEGNVSLKNDACSEPISEGHACPEVAENQEEIRSTEEEIEVNNHEQAIEDIIEERGDHTLKGEITVEESTTKESHESQEILTYDETNEKLAPASPVETVEISSEPTVYKDEGTKTEEEMVKGTEETNADPEYPESKFSEIESDGEKEEKTLIDTGRNTKSDKCSTSIIKNAKEVSEEPNISLVSETKEGEAVEETFQQDASGERTDDEVKFVESTELSRGINFPEPYNEKVQKEKEKEFGKAVKLIAGEIIGDSELQADVSSRKEDAGQSETKPDLAKFESGDEPNNASTLQIDCQNEKEITAAEIIASHICLGIETEEQLKTVVTHADEKTFKDRDLHDEKTENALTSFGNPVELICSSEVGQAETEHPNTDHEPQQEVEEKLQTTASSAVPGLEEPLEFECDESRSESIPAGESKNDAETSLAILNVQEIHDLNEKGEIDASSQLNMKSHKISEESRSSCKTSTYNHEKPENFEQLNEIQSEVALSKEIGKDTPPQTLENELASENDPSHSESYEAATSSAANEEVEFVESRVEASRLSHENIVPETHDVEVQDGKAEEFVKELDICFAQEAQQKYDREQVTDRAGEIVTGEIISSTELSSRDVDASQLEAKPNLDNGGKFTNASTLQIHCQDDKEITAAEIIAKRIYLGIETEEQAEQLKSLDTDADFKDPVELICPPEVRQGEIEQPNIDDVPIRDLKQTQEVEERIQTMDGSAEPDLEERPLKVNGAESSSESIPSGESKSGSDELPVAIWNVREVHDLNEKGETDASPQLNLKSHQISEESLGSSCKTSTNHVKPENLEQINEIPTEKLPTSEEILKNTPPQTVEDEIVIKSSPLNLEVYEAKTPDAAPEKDSSDSPALGQRYLITSKSCDEGKKSPMIDKQSAEATFSVSPVSVIKETMPTEPNPSKEKDSEQPPLTENVSNRDNISTQSIQLDKEEKLQDNYDEFHLSSQLQESSGDNPINERGEETIDTIGDIHNTNRGTSITEPLSLAPVASVTAKKEEIMSEEHNETEAESMPPNSATSKPTIGNRKGENIVIEKSLQAQGNKAAEEPKTEKEIEIENEKNDQHGEDLELRPMMILETSRDMELKTQHKKSQNILSGMSSKMKHSISKVKKAMACTSPQFTPDDVIVKLNKSRKS